MEQISIQHSQFDDNKKEKKLTKKIIFCRNFLKGYLFTIFIFFLNR